MCLCDFIYLCALAAYYIMCLVFFVCIGIAIVGGFLHFLIWLGIYDPTADKKTKRGKGKGNKKPIKVKVYRVERHSRGH